MKDTFNHYPTTLRLLQKTQRLARNWPFSKTCHPNFGHLRIAKVLLLSHLLPCRGSIKMTLGIEGQCFWVAVSRVSAESELFSKIYCGFRNLPNSEFCPKITFSPLFLSKTRFSQISQPKKFHLTPADLLTKFHDFRTLVAKSR